MPKYCRCPRCAQNTIDELMAENGNMAARIEQLQKQIDAGPPTSEVVSAQANRIRDLTSENVQLKDRWMDTAKKNGQLGIQAVDALHEVDSAKWVIKRLLATIHVPDAGLEGDARQACEDARLFLDGRLILPMQERGERPRSRSSIENELEDLAGQLKDMRDRFKVEINQTDEAAEELADRVEALENQVGDINVMVKKLTDDRI